MLLLFDSNSYVSANLVSAIISSYLKPTIKAWWLASLAAFKLEQSIAAACIMITFLGWEFRMPMIYSGRWDVQRRMQMSLVRKYLSLDPMDMEDVPGLEDRFRQAIFSTAPALSNECFMACHNSLASVFSIVRASRHFPPLDFRRP